MRAKMLIRYKFDRTETEVYVEPGKWAKKGLPYVFRNVYHAAQLIRTDGWMYKAEDYRLEWRNENGKENENNPLEDREDASD